MKNNSIKENKKQDRMEENKAKKIKNMKFLNIIKGKVGDTMLEIIENCSKFMMFYADESKEKLKLMKSNSCKNRFCPMCSWRKAKKDAQLRVFLTLMADRKSTPITKEWVDALNTIDVVFQENKKVRHAWREYLDSLNEKSPHFDSSNSFRLDLLSEMAVSLGYKNLKQTEIDRFYSPKYFGSQMSRQEILFQENLRILTRSKSCAESFTDEEYEQHYKELMEQQGE